MTRFQLKNWLHEYDQIADTPELKIGTDNDLVDFAQFVLSKIYERLPNDEEIQAECDKQGYAPSSFTSGAGFVINRIEKLLSNE